MMRRTGEFAAVVLSACALGAVARDASLADAPYLDAKRPIVERVDDLIARMTLDEKCAQLSTSAGFAAYEVKDGQVGPSQALVDLYAKLPGCGLFSFFRADAFCAKRSWANGLTPEIAVRAHNAIQRYAIENTRLGIPLSLSSIHGQLLGETTVPSGLGCAAMWDLDAIAAATRLRIRERASVARTYGVGHPTCDLALDPRWGRVEQTFGEDPFLSAEINYVRAKTAVSLGGEVHLAHFIGHGAGEAGRMSQPVHAGMNEILNLHMRPFEYAVRGGATEIMSCYNLVDGVPGLIRGDLANGFIRGRLGFKGVFIADACAFADLVRLGFAEDYGEAASLCFRNGNDMCCWEEIPFSEGIRQAVGRGQLDMEEIDRSVRRVLTDRFARGLFERPYVDEKWTADHGRPEEVIGCAAHRAIACELARKAMTLLENSRGVLPLDPKKVGRIAVIGPNADKPSNQLGDYTAPQKPGQTTTPRMGLERLGEKYGFAVEYARGCKVRSADRSGFADALAAARKSDAVVLCLGGASIPDSRIEVNAAGTTVVRKAESVSEQDKDAGEGSDRAQLRLPGVQVELLKELRKLGKPIVTVLIMGRPLILDEVRDNSDAVLLAWYPGTEGGRAIAETVFGLNNPAGRLPVSLPRFEGALPCAYHALRRRGNYTDLPCAPLYPFGYGLSYTTFALSAPELNGNEVTVRVTNSGTRAGDDVVQLYLRDMKFTVARPLRELRGFRRVSLRPGETQSVSFRLTEKELGYWNASQRYVVEPGEFRIWVVDNTTPDFKLPVKSVSYVLK